MASPVFRTGSYFLKEILCYPDFHTFQSCPCALVRVPNTYDHQIQRIYFNPIEYSIAFETPYSNPLVFTGFYLYLISFYSSLPGPYKGIPHILFLLVLFLFILQLSHSNLIVLQSFDSYLLKTDFFLSARPHFS